MNNTYCIIMAGGVGTRFWPLSRTKLPKQFLDVLGTGRTLIQQTFDRFAKIMPSEHIYVVTNAMYKSLIQEQIPEFSDDRILCEPAMRNTAPCIAYATYKIMSKDPDASFIVAPSDHLVMKEPEFLAYMEQGLSFVKETDGLLTLGIHPSRPETGYGYIQAKSADVEIGGLYPVKTFTEKPHLDLAKVFVDSGEFFWNAGIFVWKGTTIVAAFQKHLEDIALVFEEGKDKYYTKDEQDYINHIYPACRRESIDYGIMEKAQNAYVLCADFGWSDLGTWGSLYGHLETDTAGNATWDSDVLLYEAENNIVKMQGGKVAVIQGISDSIIVETDEVLMICKKGEEQRIKQFVNDVKMNYREDFV